MTYWTYETRWGTFEITPKDDRFIITFNGYSLGSYHSAI
jgi:hypothetical protein